MKKNKIVCLEQQRKLLAGTSRVGSREDADVFLREKRKRRRVSGVEVLRHFTSFEESFCPSSLFSPSPFARNNVRAHSLPYFSILSFSRANKLLSWTPWRLRGLPRYADGRAREGSWSRHRMKKKPPPPLPAFDVVSQLALSLPLLPLNPLSQSQVFVGGLSWATDDARLRQYFSNFGEVSEVRKLEDEEESPSRRRRSSSASRLFFFLRATPSSS